MADILLPGDAGFADVLSGKKFTSKNGYNVAGTMVENGALNYNPSTAAQNIPAGHTTGGTVNPVTGSAVAAHVLSGEGFSSVSGIGQSGSMIRRTGAEFPGYERAGAVMGISGRVHLYGPPGAYIDLTADQGGGHFGLFSDDANFIAANILNGKTIFGLAGSLIQGKPYASGTASTGASGSYTTLNGSTLMANGVTVSGLNMPNGIAMIKLYSWSAATDVTEYSVSNFSSNTAAKIMSYSGSAPNIYQVIAPASVSNTGFTLPVNYSGSYTYEVYGL
ncbi:MAG: hypothetical protein JWP44_5120 [Mucilaginibacter sp.]|nr:hypothetical protein [Mucilaginibacter sp.]